MNFLGLYNLIMALTVAGTCNICDPDTGSSYRSQAEQLPPAASVINYPLTRVDEGYWPAFYWNHPHDEDADNDDGDDRGYGRRQAWRDRRQDDE